jgi:hypothetical protein
MLPVLLARGAYGIYARACPRCIAFPASGLIVASSSHRSVHVVPPCTVHSMMAIRYCNVTAAAGYHTAAALILCPSLFHRRFKEPGVKDATVINDKRRSMVRLAGGTRVMGFVYVANTFEVAADAQNTC